jgi:hypothetical protein
MNYRVVALTLTFCWTRVDAILLFNFCIRHTTPVSSNIPDVWSASAANISCNQVILSRKTLQWLWYNTCTSWRGRGVYCFTSVRLFVLPSVQDIFRRIFLSNCWWQKSDIWSQALYRYPISWEAFLDPSDSYFLFADLVGFYTHWTYMHIFRHIFLSNYRG